MIKYNISHEYEIDLWDEGVYDREGLDIAWICACLNPMRYSIERKMNLFQKNFKLSPFYILFFHLYDRSSFFLDKIIEMRMLPISDAKLKKTLDSPVSYSGGWTDFKRIVINHGVVPLHAMTGGEIHSHRTELITVLSDCLAFHAKQIRDCDENEVDAKHTEAVSAVSDILIKYLGEPPETFNWNYKTADGEDNSLKGISPLDFYNKYCDFKVEETRILMSYELEGKIPKCEDRITYLTGDYLAMTAALNLADNKDLVIAGVDIRHQANQMLGILDTDFCDGEEVSMSKKDMIDYGRLAVTDYLTIDGCENDTNHENFSGILRFKAQDSCGADTGADGHYTMSIDWFKKYVLFIISTNKMTLTLN